MGSFTCRNQARQERSVAVQVKHIGKNKLTFTIIMFCNIRMDTLKDTLVSQMADPDHWITRVGRILLKALLDELSQLWNVLVSDMFIIGPCLALWNQDDLVT